MFSRSRTVLLADDLSVLRHKVRERFEDIGFIVVGEAENGSVAVALAREHHPDLVVLDLSMPIMNGLQVASEVIRALPRTIVILFTAYADSAIVQRKALAAGISRVVSKSDISKLIDDSQELTRHLN
jgi:DNA-binding NarL/FixJ family response regulator